MELKNTEKLEHSQVKLTVAVSAEELDKAKEAAYKKSKNQFQIPGFRKGKATRKVIERLYGKDFFIAATIRTGTDASILILSRPKFTPFESRKTEEKINAPKTEVGT